MNEIDFHENLKQCAICSYGKNLMLPANYQATNNYVNLKSGFSSSVIRNGENVIVAYRGSDEWSAKDIGADLKMGILSKIPSQAWDAVSVYMKVRQQFPNARIYLTGHSLGGSLAQIVGALFDVNTVTFNAYGTKDLIKPNYTIYPDKITNYVNLDDYKVMIDNTENQIGTCYSIGTRIGSKKIHDAESMLSLEKRKKFDQQYYAKPRRYKMNAPKEVHTGNDVCPGVYPVSGYTREDGTHVNGYTRECYIHGQNTVKSYLGKTLNEMTKEEIDELVADNI